MKTVWLWRQFQKVGDQQSGAEVTKTCISTLRNYTFIVSISISVHTQIDLLWFVRFCVHLHMRATHLFRGCYCRCLSALPLGMVKLICWPAVAPVGTATCHGAAAIRGGSVWIPPSSQLQKMPSKNPNVHRFPLSKVWFEGFQGQIMYQGWLSSDFAHSCIHLWIVCSRSPAVSTNPPPWPWWKADPPLLLVAAPWHWISSPALVKIYWWLKTAVHGRWGLLMFLHGSWQWIIVSDGYSLKIMVIDP